MIYNMELRKRQSKIKSLIILFRVLFFFFSIKKKNQVTTVEV